MYNRHSKRSLDAVPVAHCPLQNARNAIPPLFTVGGITAIILQQYPTAVHSRNPVERLHILVLLCIRATSLVLMEGRI